MALAETAAAKLEREKRKIEERMVYIYDGWLIDPESDNGRYY
jgi:hypothetical protein